MNSQKTSSLGFSLVEVSAALGVLSIALVSLLALVPLGLSNTRACKGETRAVELAGAVSATLATEPFRKARCFSTEESALDLGTLNNSDAGDAPTVLYASYDVRRHDDPEKGRAPMQITRSTSIPEEWVNDNEVYRIELRNSPDSHPFDAAIVGSTVRIAIYLANEKIPVFTGSTYIGAFRRLGALEQGIQTLP